MVAAADALPAGAEDGEIVLSEKNVLLLASESVSEVGFVNIAIVHTETFPEVPNRSEKCISNAFRCDR